MSALAAGSTPAPVPPRAAGRRRRAVADVAPVAVAGALAAVLTAISLTGRSLGFDEGATVAIVSQHGHALWRAIAHDGGNMSGYYLLMHVLVGWFGDGPVLLRLPSLVGAAATPALVAAIALMLFDRRVAWVAGVLSAVSLPLIYWGQSARGYALMLAFTCAGMLAFCALVRADAEDRPWIGVAAVYVVAMALAAYCSFVAVLIVPAQLLVLVHRGRAARRLFVALVALAICGIPLAILAARRGSGQLFWLPHPSRQVETQVLQLLASTGLQPNIHRTFTTTAGWVATVVAVVAIGAWAVRARRVGRVTEPLAGWGTATVLSWAVLPAALTFVWSLVSQPMFYPRNLLISVPGVALVLAVAIADRRLPRWVAATALALALLVRAVPVAAGYGVSPEPWRQATAAVLADARPGDCIAFYPEDGRNAFRYYVSRSGPAAARRAPRAVLPAVSWSETRPFVEIYSTLSPARVAALRRACGRMWLVTSHEGQRNGPARSRHNRAGWYALRARLQRAFGRAPVRTFGYASAIHVQLLGGRGGGR